MRAIARLAIMTTPERQLRQAQFWRKYLRLTRAGVPVLRALAIIAREEENAAFRDTVQALLDRIEGGATLSAAASANPAEFSAAAVELIRTAARRGAWDEVLAELADGLAEGTFR